MATLEKSSARSSLEQDDSVSELTRPSPLDSAVPTPFPQQPASVASTTATTEGRKGRSPSIGRKVIDSVKRSFSRDRTVGDDSRSRSGERRQSDAASAQTTEERGRSILHPLRPSTTNATTVTNSSRSTSRGRVLATGRGGAGNMRLPTGESTPDETSDTIAQARENAKSRSRSRGREIHAVGRGGAGNLRDESGSRNRLSEKEQEAMKRKEEVDAEMEREVLERREREGVEGLRAQGVRGFSSGRGGAGNIRPILGTGTAAAHNPHGLSGQAA